MSARSLQIGAQPMPRKQVQAGPPIVPPSVAQLVFSRVASWPCSEASSRTIQRSKE